MYDRLRSGAATAGTSGPDAQLVPGKQTNVPPSIMPIGGAVAPVATPHSGMIDPSTIGTGPGMPAPGAAPFDDGQGCWWILRNDQCFECVQAPPLATGKLHAVVDRDAQPEAWLALVKTGGAGKAGVAVQAKGGAMRGAEPLQLAATGVAGANDPLPHLPRIQLAFGRHDVGGVRAAVGGPAAQASRALGASAYATGDRVAFAGAPDLHTAAHEAAHVVQQRAGVSLAGGVGRSGDPYEQHADRVADLVVRGESAEAALDEMAGGGARTRAVQRFDSPNHIAIGDSVVGGGAADEGITILGVAFTPGQCAALVDYVGPLFSFRHKCEQELKLENAATQGETVRRLEAMKQMLIEGNEDTLMWDELTNGSYSKLTENNEDHFNGGGEAANHSASFVDLLVAALVDGAGGEIERGRMHLYTAEHYLQDMFSSGHLADQADIDAAIDGLLTGNAELVAMMPIIADSVYALGAEIIACYAIDVPMIGPRPLDRAAFHGLVLGGAMLKYGENALARSSLRKFVHEQLDAGVEVSSPAHPTPWTMQGDHSLTTKGQEETVVAAQAAIADTRDLFDRNTASPIKDREGQAHALLAHHKPVPTGNGAQTIKDAIKQGTATRMLFMNAMIEAGHATLIGVLDYCVGQGYLVRLKNPNEPLGPADAPPELDRGARDPDEGFVPEDRPSYVDAHRPPEIQLKETPDQLGEAPDRDADVAPDVDVDTAGTKNDAIEILHPVAGFARLGEVIEAATPSVGDGLGVECVVRLPAGGPLSAVGKFVVDAERTTDGYSVTMRGDLGIAVSPAAGVHFELCGNVAISGQGATGERAAAMLGLALETVVRSAPSLPVPGLRGKDLADRIWGRGNVFREAGELEDGDGFGASTGADGGIRVHDPASGIELKGKGGVIEEHTIAKEAGEDATLESSRRLQFEGELEHPTPFGAVSFGGEFDLPWQKSDPKAGTFTGIAKGFFAGGNPKAWAAGLAGALGCGISLLARALVSHAAASKDAAAFARSLSSLESVIEASVNRIACDALLTVPGAQPGTGVESKSGVEATISLDTTTKEVKFAMSTVIESGVEEPMSGTKIEVEKKSQVVAPVRIAQAQ
jgi:hypothetical protein